MFRERFGCPKLRETAADALRKYSIDLETKDEVLEFQSLQARHRCLQGMSDMLLCGARLWISSSTRKTTTMDELLRKPPSWVTPCTCLHIRSS